MLADKAAPTYLYDGTLVMENLMLAAHDEGLGSCWIHRAKEEFESKEGKEILKSLGIEGDYEGIGHCVIGYVNGEYPKTSPRRENRVFMLNEGICFEGLNKVDFATVKICCHRCPHRLNE